MSRTSNCPTSTHVDQKSNAMFAKRAAPPQQNTENLLEGKTGPAALLSTSNTSKRNMDQIFACFI